MKNRIPESEYYQADFGPYITYDLFKKFHSQEGWVSFSSWMRGQTCSLVNNVYAYYSWDYERWLKGLPCID